MSLVVAAVRSLSRKLRRTPASTLTGSVRHAEMTTLEPLEQRRHLSVSPHAAHRLKVPNPARVLVVVMENHSYSEIANNATLPFLYSIGQGGAVFSNSHAVDHPSQPNYLALFSGSTQGVTDDNPISLPFNTSNLSTELHAKGLGFAAYSESMPANGYSGGDVGPYAIKHNPTIDFTNVPSSANLTFDSFPKTASALKSLPAVSFIFPNLNNDMHDGTARQGDHWLHANLLTYVKWARTHNSLLIVTWDEDDRLTQDNQIPTFFYGPMVKPGIYDEHITHYNVLRTIEDMFGTSHTSGSANVGPIRDTWL